VHHIGLADLLFAAKLTREKPLELCLIGIQPKSLDIGLEMTSDISTQLDRIIEFTLLKLTQWNITSSLGPSRMQ
jgi:hydrogenase maturation protease